MATPRRRLLSFAIALTFLAACVADESTAPLQGDGASSPEHLLELGVQGHDHDHPHSIVIPSAADAARMFADGVATLDHPDAFQQVSAMIDAADLSELAYRARQPDGGWTPWQAMEVTWNEGDSYNVRALLEHPTNTIELRGGASIQFAAIELFGEIVARRELITAQIAPPPRDDLQVVRQAVAPRSLVIPRAEWGALNPDKICGSIVAPYRMSIHHTYLPSGDGGDAPARMRQMQSFHINDRGWCDIGYHFVIAQSGSIYQGRSDERRPGAHVGNQNNGNVGISFIADFVAQTPTNTQLDAGAKMVKWVHETYNIALDRTVIKGHREWPGQSTSCPGPNMITRIDEILTRAGAGPIEPPPPPNYDVEIKVNYLGLENFYTQGSSANLPDTFAGDTFQAEILITNKSESALRGVLAGYWIEAPFLTATSYTIYTDHPVKDQSTWVVNDADTNPGNPAKDALGSSGTLIMHAFGLGETKRVLIDLRADRYSIGFADHPDVRGWVSNIDEVYVQPNFGDTPSPNLVGSHLQAYAELDVMSRDEWHFASNNAEDLEGWSGAGSDYDELRINTNHSLLAMHVTGSDPQLVSPTWTRINADTFDQMVLRARSHDGDHIKAIYFARDGESFSEDRVVRVQAPGTSEAHTLVIPVGEHPHWSGTITRLRVDLLDDRAPAAGDSGWYDIDKIFFQDSTSNQTTSATEAFDMSPVVPLVSPDDTVIPNPIPPGDTEDPDNGHLTPGGSFDASAISVNEGCSSLGSGRVPTDSAVLVMVALLGLCWVRRKG